MGGWVDWQATSISFWVRLGLSEPPKRPERFRKRFSKVSPICSRKRFRFVFSTFRFTFPIRFRRSGVFSTFSGNTFPIRFRYVSNTFPSFRPGGKNANRRKRFQYVFSCFGYIKPEPKTFPETLWAFWRFTKVSTSLLPFGLIPASLSLNTTAA